MKLQQLIIFSAKAKDFTTMTGLDTYKLAMNHSLTEKDFIPFEELFSYTSNLYSNYHNLLNSSRIGDNYTVDDENDIYSTVFPYYTQALQSQANYLNNLLDTCLYLKNKYAKARNTKIIEHIEKIYKRIEKNKTDKNFRLSPLARFPDSYFKYTKNALSYLRAFETTYDITRNQINLVPAKVFKELLHDLDIINTFNYLESKI